MSAIVVVGAGVLVGNLARQEVVRSHEDGVRHGHDRFLVSPVPDPTITRGEGGGGGVDAGGDYDFQLAGEVQAYLYQKNAPITEEDRASLVDEIRRPCTPKPKSN